ncbi:sodium:proton antiporter [Gammaproteobacteria bacterium 45_16_T64]|nr:sodium:proton antiporter [Gammaproteobacteria bacterium 45_16_T64]
MGSESLIFSVFLIFSGAGVLASIALFTRQPLIVAYIVLGILFGPYGFKLVKDAKTLEEIGHIGIVFLLFLLGLDLQPRNFLQLLSRTALVALTSAAALGATGFGISYIFGFTQLECWIVGIATTFSSTIIGIKLLPTTVLHHKHTGEMLISILLLQDIFAIAVLIMLNGGKSLESTGQVIQLLAALPGLIIFAMGFVRWVMLPLLRRFDRFHEYIFLLAIGWCLSLAVMAEHFQLSLEIGAFVAGISLANSPIAQYIAINLKPLRDFFLILFFFTIGAGFNLILLPEIIVPAGLLATAVLILKPVLYSKLLHSVGEDKQLSWEVGFRLGQTSEFSLLVAYVASSLHYIGDRASLLIQATTILTFLFSTYIIVFRYPSPIAVSDRLRRD